MITLGEGQTPLVELPRLAAQVGVAALHAKLESTNPTGSYKDRIAARSMDAALEAGQRGWIATSSGNAGTSFAAYGRRAGLPGVLCVSHTITREKLLPALALGARVVRVKGLGHESGRAMERELFATVEAAALQLDLYLGVTAHRFNDRGMRAADAIAHEAVAVGTPFDVVYVPTGGGGLVAAVARGMVDAGSAAAVVAAQPAGCAPIARHLLGELDTPVIERNSSRISGLQLPGPPDGELASELIRRTGGWGTTATDEEIVAATAELATAEGVFVEPASGCALAGLRSDLAAGRLDGAAHVLLVLTGSGLKDLATIEQGLAPPPEADVAELPALIPELLR